MSMCPKDNKLEYAFIGRSNVGKSSLINMLCNHKGLAKTSATPGKTLLINHFIINNEWYLVDLPGYGFAKRSKTVQKQLEQMISLKQFQAAQRQLQSALSVYVNAVHEAYPDLKANENFRDLMTQLEGTENRINTARRDFNEAAKGYNTTIRRFPKNILAGMFGFEKKAYFEAEQGAEKAPKVEF